MRRPARRVKVALGLMALVAAFLAVPPPQLQAPVSTVLLARDGTLLGATLAADGQWRMPRLQHVPDRLGRAVIAMEDKRFRSHHGVDVLAVGRALRLNLARHQVVSGASTLTMQVSRLSRPGAPRSLGEKLLEAVLALRLELATSKDDILLTWLQHAPFGGNVVGAPAASWRYFGKDVDSLSWAEAATLAVLPNSPTLVHPGRGVATLAARRDRVLRKLNEHGAFDEATLKLALAEPLPTTPKALPMLAPHLLARAETVLPGTSTVTTTLDAALQTRATQMVERHRARLAAMGVNHAAAVILDVETGAVLAWVGNFAPRESPQPGDWVDVVAAPRSTGSTLKPFLYAELLDKGELLPNQLVYDVPFSSQGFHPENFSRTYSGAVPASQALARSLNVPAVRLLSDYGVDRFHADLRALGLPLARPADDYGLTLILGGAEASLLDVTGLYAGLARTALHPKASRSQFWPPYAFSTPPPNPPHDPSLGAGAAWLTLEALQHVERPGAESAWRNFRGGYPVAWKTGTSFGFRDGWAIGVTARYAVGIWAGNATGQGSPGLMGFTAAAPLLFDVFELLPQAPWFPEPTDEVVTVDLCNESGMRAGPTCQHTHRAKVPRAGLETRACGFCSLVPLDDEGRFRVHAGCEALTHVHPTPRFVLPAGPAAWYRKNHPSYAPLPDWRPGCEPPSTTSTSVSVLYPEEGSRVYVPIELDGRRGRLVVEAAHRDARATLFWHLDDDFIATTRDFHHLNLAPAPGPHVLTVVDEAGEAVQRHFVVLDSSTHTTN